MQLTRSYGMTPILSPNITLRDRYVLRFHLPSRGKTPRMFRNSATNRPKIKAEKYVYE